ncbi:hypothetical protein ACIQUY_31800 [Streptomyces sp. NPDC090231]|uniref:hypothetical protein n=1 Tax=unclassified Streptomyces TaxID=2593676 RepID=UPI0038079B72
MRNPTDARLKILRAVVADYQGAITTRAIQQLYVNRFGPGEWRGKARQDLAQLVKDELLICDDTDPGHRVFRFNHGGNRA